MTTMILADLAETIMTTIDFISGTGKFTRDNYILNTMNVDTSDSMFICDVCGKGFNKRSYLTQHQNIHADKKPFSCPVCFKKFLYKQTYEEHLERHARNRKAQCELCGRRFYNKRELKVHKKKHAAKGEFHCEVCDLYFVEERSLQAHFNRLHVSYNCVFCTEKFPNKKRLKSHEFRQHRDIRKADKELVKTRKVVCSVCNKTLCNKWRLESHLVMKHKMNKDTITEKGLLQFRRRKGLNNILENTNRGNRFRHEDGRNISATGTAGERNYACKDSTSLSRVESTVPETKLRNMECLNCFNSVDVNVYDNKRSKNPYIDSDVNNEHSNTQYEVTITGDSTHKATTYTNSADVVKKVYYDYAKRRFTLEDVQKNVNKNSESDIFCEDQTLSIETENVDETSNNHKTYSEKDHRLSPQHHAYFTNDDINSDSTCSVDLSETNRLVECDVTDSYEVLQHEFDEIVDADENNDDVENGASMADCHVRPSSEALQEYFERYSRKVADRNKDLTTIFKETDFKKVAEGFHKNSNIKTLDTTKRSTIAFEAVKTNSLGKRVPAFQRIKLHSEIDRSSNEEDFKKLCRPTHTSSDFVAAECGSNSASSRDKIHCDARSSEKEIERGHVDNEVSGQDSMPKLERRNLHSDITEPKTKQFSNADFRKPNEVPTTRTDNKASDAVGKVASEICDKTETCFKCPASLTFVTEKKRPRIYSVKGRNTFLSQKQAQLQTSRALSDVNERTAFGINRVKEISSFERWARNTSCTCVDNASAQNVKEQNLVPLIFRIRRDSNLEENVSSSSLKSNKRLQEVPIVMPPLHSLGYERNTEMSENLHSTTNAMSLCPSDNIKTPDENSCVSLSNFNHNKNKRTSPKRNDEMNKFGQNLPKLVSGPGGKISNENNTFIDKTESFGKFLQTSSGETLLAVPLQTDFSEDRLRKERNTDDCRGSYIFTKDGERGNKYGLQDTSESKFNQRNILYRKENVTKVFDEFVDVREKSAGVSWPSASTSDETFKRTEDISLEENALHKAKLNKSKVSSDLEVLKDSIKDKLNSIQHSSDYVDFLDEVINLLQMERLRKNRNEYVD